MEKLDITILVIVLIDTLALLVLAWWLMKQESERVSEYWEYIPEEFGDPPTVAGQCSADCKRPVTRGKKIWCNNTKPCTTLGCKCNLYSKLKANPNSDWEKLGKGKKNYTPKTHFYRCWCTN